MRQFPITLLLLVSFFFGTALQAEAQRRGRNAAQETQTEDPLKGVNLSGLAFRSIGPALTSGRIADFAVNPEKPHEYYVAVASGGVWKTTNNGTTWSPIFDAQGSYSIGCVSLDPSNPNTVWVGTGENNNQRSVAYGDGVYRSRDGGKTWEHMGLKNSEHIGSITVDPRDPNTVIVAAIGPLWSEGGDRGVYKTTDGGKTWKAVLTVDEHTGANEVVRSPHDPNTLYASMYQRRRHVFTWVSGGPGSGVWKSTDNGDTWRQVKTGLPSKLGRVGLAVSPADENYVYAILEAEGGASGFYRSTDRGESWEKRNSYSTSGNYYTEIIADPKNRDRVYSMDTWMHVTEDGGKTFAQVPETSKHVDNHCLYINPNNTAHILAGCDGGIYESYDRGKTWDYKANLPIIQFYKIGLDNAEPFYNVYGGTQDNFTIGGPARTINVNGIMNEDWFVTNGGDGFQTRVDPQNPDIVYSESQYGWLVRYDKKSGERVSIQPQEREEDEAYRWNWDAPLIISPHSPKTLYFAANRLFKSEDRGNTWQVISEDLTQQINRDELEVFGEIQSVDAVARHMSTSEYGTIVALDESKMQAGLLAVGTDDGLIQLSEDDGKNWRKMEAFTGVPKNTYVNDLLFSYFDKNTLYAAFNNHKNGDFKPYLLKSTDLGQTWTSITEGLPERGSVYCIEQDHENENLLFCGTEFGVFVTIDGGKHWTALKNGLPTVAVRDLALQRRENDLVLATFGRGFYVLDDYTPLRALAEKALEEEEKARIFAPRRALMYIQAAPLGIRGKGFLGDALYLADNPKFGATFTYYFGEELKTLKAQRQAAEAEAREAGKAIAVPTWEELKAEDQDEAAYLLFTITDTDGNVVRKLRAPASTGIQRITWDLRHPDTDPAQLSGGGPANAFDDGSQGPLALPGKYKVHMALVDSGQVETLVENVEFEAVPLQNTTLPAEDRAAAVAFNRDMYELSRVTQGVYREFADLEKRIPLLGVALHKSSIPAGEWEDELEALRQKKMAIRELFSGDATKTRRQTGVPPGLQSRIGTIVYAQWNHTGAPTQTMKDGYEIAKKQLAEVEKEIAALREAIQPVEKALEEAGAPYTPGRTPALKEK